MRTVLCDMEAEQGLGLSKKSHAVAKPLWMQRTFTQASGASLPACAAKVMQHEQLAQKKQCPIAVHLGSCTGAVLGDTVMTNA